MFIIIILLLACTSSSLPITKLVVHSSTMIRNNTGGLWKRAVMTSSVSMPSATLVSTKDTYTQTSPTFKSDKLFLPGPEESLTKNANWSLGTIKSRSQLQPIIAGSMNPDSSKRKSGYQYLTSDSKVNQHIKYLSKVSSLCYEREILNGKIEDLNVLHVIDQGKYLAIIAQETKTKNLILSFRGTNALPNWADNMRLDLTNWEFFTDPNYTTSPIRVHNGFSRAWTSLRAKVFRFLDSPEFKKYFGKLNKLQITGHSMGGAVASIAALDIANSGRVKANRIDLINFGSPRVGNIAFAMTVNDRGFGALIRVIHEEDMIPSVPGKKLGYKHHKGERVVVDDKVCIKEEGNANKLCGLRGILRSFNAHTAYLDM